MYNFFNESPNSAKLSNFTPFSGLINNHYIFDKGSIWLTLNQHFDDYFFLNESKTFWLWDLTLAGWRSWDGETFKFISTLEFGLKLGSFRETKEGKLYVIWWFLYPENLLVVSKFVERRKIKGRTTKSEKAFTVTFFCPNW